MSSFLNQIGAKQEPVMTWRYQVLPQRCIWNVIASRFNFFVALFLSVLIGEV